MGKGIKIIISERVVSPSNSIPPLLTRTEIKADRTSAGIRFAFPEINQHYVRGVSGAGMSVHV